jgi:diadenosine tetraphosphate (Ap4A) HIT family hydrolase
VPARDGAGLPAAGAQRRRRDPPPSVQDESGVAKEVLSDRIFQSRGSPSRLSDPRDTQTVDRPANGIMRHMSPQLGCVSCFDSARTDLAPRDRVYLSPRWRVAHAFGTRLPGWLVVLPRRHVTVLDELTLAEQADLGPLLAAVTAALREIIHCSKTYVALFAEAEGFEHIHFHVVPRMADLDPALRGPFVFELLTGDTTTQVPEEVRDQIASQLAASASLRALSGRRDEEG